MRKTKCSACKAQRILHVECDPGDEGFLAVLNGIGDSGQLLTDLGLGTEKMTFDLCLNCGQLQGTWPLPPTYLENEETTPPHPKKRRRKR